MLKSGLTWLIENIRCARHNFAHLRVFRIWYTSGFWFVSDGKIKMRFSRYPYLAFHDIEGYLFEKKWVPQEDEVVLDAGGCFGEFAIYAALRVGPKGKVIMLEPDLRNISVAEEYMRLNGFPRNLSIVPVGLWSENTKLMFDSGNSEQSVIVRDGTDQPGLSEIDVVTIDTIVSRYKLSRLDYVKMDIEGAELEAILGAVNLPPNMKPKYMIASYHIVDGKETCITLEEIFSRIGYSSLTGNRRHKTTWAWSK